jgi:hypothetical protein
MCIVHSFNSGCGRLPSLYPADKASLLKLSTVTHPIPYSSWYWSGTGYSIASSGFKEMCADKIVKSQFRKLGLSLAHAVNCLLIRTSLARPFISDRFHVNTWVRFTTKAGTSSICFFIERVLIGGGVSVAPGSTSKRLFLTVLAFYSKSSKRTWRDL